MGAALAACLPAPRAAADCTSHLPSFGMASLPFDGPSSAPNAKHSTPAHQPCHGPYCGRTPAEPAPAPSAPPRSSVGEEWAWVESVPTPASGCRPVWAGADGLLAPLFFPSPLERPPR